MANGKYLAPGEHGLIGASAAADERGGVPLDSVAWRVQEVSGSWDHSGWVRLQHLLSGKYLRLVVPPDPMEWTFTVEREPEPHGKQTWFQIECSREPCSGGSVHVRVHPEATGAHINYRGADLVRGHGDRQPWMPSSQSASSLVRLETFGLARLASDMAKWAPRRRACLAPCEEAADAVLGEGGSWDEVCASVYAEPFCAAMVRVHGTRPAVTWGSAPAPARMRWARLGCQNYLSTQDVNALAGLDVSRSVAQVPPPRRVPAAAPTRSGGGVSTDEARMHCVQPTDGVLLLLVSDRPNQFLCHYFAAAMAHSLRPTILGWDPGSWLGGGRPKPWTFHLGAKLVAPLHYLRACGYPNETLVVFTDHDVIFQGGYTQLRAAYASAVASASAPILFSTENEPYPSELKPLYPPKPRGAAFRFLNSGMWMGPAGAIAELLEVMAGVRRGDPLPMLLDTYLNWGSPHLAPTPRAYVDNDQLTYACLFVSQHVSDSCRAGGAGRQRPLGSRRCVTCPHDGRRRCMRAGGLVDCSDRSVWEEPPLGNRLGLDYGLHLFENLYHAGRHRLENGRIRHVGSGATPLAVHFNGPAKVIHEAQWGLPAWGSKQDQPKQLRDAICATLSPAERAAADVRFLTHATFLDPTFRRIPGGIGPLNASCTGVQAE